MPQGNAPKSQKKFGCITVSIFDNGPSKMLGVRFAAGMKHVLLRPGHSRALRRIADWLEQEAIRLGHPVLPSRRPPEEED